jgi:hypothetical protein
MPTSPSVTGSGYTALLGRNAHGGVRRSLSQVAPCVIERRSDEQSEPQSGFEELFGVSSGFEELTGPPTPPTRGTHGD